MATPPQTSPSGPGSAPSQTQLPPAARLSLPLAIVQRFGSSRPSALLVPLVLATMAIQTGCSTATATGPGPTPTIEPPTIEIPAAPLMPADLPAVCLWPRGDLAEAIRDYHCTGSPRAGDIVVPSARWWAVRDLLDDWAQYPELCQGAVDDSNTAWQAIVRGLAKVEAARQVEERVRAEGGMWRATSAYLGILLGVGAGAAIGFAVGAIVVATQ